MIYLDLSKPWIFQKHIKACFYPDKDYGSDYDLFGMVEECPLTEPNLIMETFDAKKNNFGWDCAMLIVFFLALRIMAYLALKIKVVIPLLWKRLYTVYQICLLCKIIFDKFYFSYPYIMTICWLMSDISSNN